MTKLKNKGIILLIVLCTFFIVILLANIILSLISSQSRLTHHEVSRIQAYYAAMAGISYAYDGLRSELLPAPAPFYSLIICNPAIVGCVPNIPEPNLSSSIQQVQIFIVSDGASVAGVPGCSPCNHPSVAPFACICSVATYND